MLSQLSSSKVFARIQGYVKQQLAENSPAILWPLASAMTHSAQPHELPKLLDNYLACTDQLVLLLLGDAGMGKTVCLQDLVRRLLVQWSEDKPIPLYLKLSKLKTSFAQLMQDFFLACGFKPEEIAALKTHCIFIVIADAYDASLGFIPLYSSAQDELMEWRIEKWLISARTSYFFNQPQYLDLFTYYQKADQKRVAPQVMQLLPLSMELIKKAISTKLDQASQDYLIKDGGLLALSTNTLMLTLLLKHLPQLLNHSKIAAYQRLLTTWIEHQIERLRTHSLIGNGVEALEHEALWYIVAIARRLKDLREPEAELNFNCSTFNRRIIKPIKEGWRRFLTDTDRSTQLARACCPMQARSPIQISLFHREVYEQISQFEAPLPKPPSKLPPFLNGYEGSEILVSKLQGELEVDNAGLLSQFIGKLEEGHYSEADCFRIVYATRYQYNLEKAAANAITLLNYAGISFTGMDLSSIKIPRADLSGAIFDSTNLQLSNLQGVNFQKAWLQGANLESADMKEVYFCEWPFFELPNSNTVYACYYTADDCKIIACNGNDIYIYDINTGEQRFKLSGHTQEIESMVISANEQWIVSGGRDCTIRLWSIETGECKSIWKSVEQHRPICLAISTDSKWVAAAGTDSIIRLWSVATGLIEQQFLGHEKYVRRVGFSPDGQYLVSGGEDKTVRLWSMAIQQTIYKWDGLNDKVYSVAFSPNGSWVAAGCQGYVYLWSVKEGDLLHILKKQGQVLSLAFSPDSQLIAAGGSLDSCVHVWSVETGACQYIFECETAWAYCVTFNVNGRYLAAGCSNGIIREWHLGENKLYHEMYRNKGHTDWVTSLAVSSNNKLIASAGHDKTICLWSVKAGQRIKRWDNVSNSIINSIAISPCNQWIVAGCQDETVQVCSIKSGNIERILQQHTREVLSVAFSPNGQYFASGSGDKTICLWEVKTGQLKQIFEGHAGEVSSVIFTPDGRRLLSGGQDKTIRLWSIETGQQEYIFSGHTDWINALAFSPNGQYFVSGGNDHTVRLWSVETRSCEHIWTTAGLVKSVTFSPDSTMIAVAGWMPIIDVWEVASKKRLTINKVVFNDIYSLCWIKDGADMFLVTAGVDKAVQCWQFINIDSTLQIRLRWSSTQANLMAQDCLINNATKLDYGVDNLLLQHGAIDNRPAPELPTAKDFTTSTPKPHP